MARAQILVIDDEPLMRDFLEETLVRAGFGVVTASDGTTGLGEIRTNAYDLVITDIRMPGVDGIGLLEDREIPPSSIGRHQVQICIAVQVGRAYRGRLSSSKFEIGNEWKLPGRVLEKYSQVVVLGIRGRQVEETVSVQVPGGDRGRTIRRPGRTELEVRLDRELPGSALAKNEHVGTARN